MDAIFNEAANDGVGLIADIDWQPDEFTNLAGQKPSALANANSPSSRLLAKYIQQFISRYGNSSALMGYEAGNEFNLYADTGQYPFLTSSQVTSILKNTGADIRAYDSSRLIESGDGLDRPQAWHLAHGQGWVTDTCCGVGSQWAQMEDQFNPFGDYSAHPFSQADVSMLDQLVSLGNAEGKPVIAGEYGYANAATDQSGFQQIFNGVVTSGAPISMLWTYDTLLIPNFSWSATFTNDLAYELQAVAGQNP
jgi:endo-1,4-beta-mannosidase